MPAEISHADLSRLHSYERVRPVGYHPKQNDITVSVKDMTFANDTATTMNLKKAHTTAEAKIDIPEQEK